MKWENWHYAVAVVIIIGIGGIVVVEATKLAAQIIAAILAASGPIAVSVFRYVGEIAKQRKDHQQLAKQQNYQHLTERILEFYREGKTGREKLIVANIESWVFGDSEVVKKTLDLLESSNLPNLVSLLNEMRTSVGLPELKIDDMGIGTRWEDLIPSEQSN